MRSSAPGRAQYAARYSPSELIVAPGDGGRYVIAKGERFPARVPAGPLPVGSDWNVWKSVNTAPGRNARVAVRNESASAARLCAVGAAPDAERGPCEPDQRRASVGLVRRTAADIARILAEARKRSGENRRSGGPLDGARPAAANTASLSQRRGGGISPTCRAASSVQPLP